MGKGNTRTPTVPRQRLAEGAEAGGGRPEPELSPCARTLIISLNLRRGVALTVGDPVTIGAGRPPTARSQGLHVGEVSATDAPEIEGCLGLGFRFTGNVDAVDATKATAVVQVSGRKGR